MRNWFPVTGVRVADTYVQAVRGQRCRRKSQACFSTPGIPRDFVNFEASHCGYCNFFALCDHDAHWRGTFPVRLATNPQEASRPLPLDEDAPLPPLDRTPQQPSWIEKLYRAQSGKLLRYFSRRADRNDAHDLVQESFVRLAKAEATRDEGLACPEAYLGQIATNLLRDRAKTALRRSLANHIPAEEIPLSGTDPAAALEARDKLRRLDTALMGLKPKTRAIFLAHRLDGLSYKQIGDHFGLGVKGVEWHMGKAIAHVERSFRHP